VIIRYASGAGSGIVIANGPVTNVTTSSATFNGTLTSTGGAACAVAVLWGAEEGSDWDWANTNWFNGGDVTPAWTNGTLFSTNMTAAEGIAADKTYYYTFAATNATTNAVASSPEHFITGEVTVEAGAATVEAPATTSFTISRPSGCTNEDLTVTYMFDDGGTGYTLAASPATIDAGETSVELPLMAGSTAGDVVLTLTTAGDNPYPVGTASNAAVTIQGAQPFPAGWGYKVPITIESDDIDSALTDWTLAFDQSFHAVLTSVNGPLDADGTQASLNGGGDVRFSSDAAGTTRLACDIRTWVTDNDPASATCEVAVKVPSVSDSADTTIYMWWGKTGETQPSASDTYGQYAAYDSNTEGVYIFDETLPGGSGTVKNRKANSEHGTPANMESGDVVDGAAGKAYRFDGDTGSIESVDFGDVHNFGTDSFTIECLHSRTANEETNLRVFSNGAYNNSTPGWTLFRGNTNGSFGVGDGVSRTFAAAPSGSYTTDTIQHMAGVCDRSGNLTHWVDGVAGTPVPAPSGSVDGSDSFLIARNPADDPWAFPGPGDIDEIRLSLVARSDAWIKANYHNQLNTSGFLTWGSITPVSDADSDGTLLIFR